MFLILSNLAPGSVAYRRQRDEIIERSLPVATNIARRYGRRGEEHDDLVQVARLGLVKAVDRFDVSTGNEFLAFAVPSMIGEVRRYFRDYGWAVKVPRGIKDLSQQLNAARTDLSQELNRAPTASELAARLGIDREQVLEAVVALNAYSTHSIDAPPGTDDEPSRSLAATMGAVDQALDNVLDVHTVRPLLEALPDRERTILMMRFFENMTQTQIADRLGISQMHVSRLLSRTLTVLRDQATGQSST